MDNIGWKFENACALAWILGYEEVPDFSGHMLEGDEIKSVVLEFTPQLSADLSHWVSQQKIADVMDVLYVEHTFYCLHNAVRSAQLGGDTVPEGFHPLANGGVIQERRHALTWALSPGVHWSKTDLNT